MVKFYILLSPTERVVYPCVAEKQTCPIQRSSSERWDVVAQVGIGQVACPVKDIKENMW